MSSSEYQLVFSIIASLTLKFVMTCALWQPVEGTMAKSMALLSPFEGKVAEAKLQVGLVVVMASLAVPGPTDVVKTTRPVRVQAPMLL